MRYAYTGSETRYYPAFGITATPGDVVELAALPADGRWELADAKTSPKAKPPTETPIADLGTTP